jgi:ATP-dependent Clp protease ATP-binding subunit ClpB
VTRNKVLAEIKIFFKPEFYNRVDDIILFTPLHRKELDQIIDLQIAAIQKRLDERRITLAVGAEAREWLIDRGYSPLYGARPLKRLLQKEVETLLARAIISGSIADGAQVKVIIRNDRPALAP